VSRVLFTSDLELFSLLRGHRSLAKREGPDAVPILKATLRLKAIGLEVGYNERSGAAYLGRDPEHIREAILLENRELVGRDSEARRQAITRLGELLGYPPCCTEAFAALPGQDDPAVLTALLDRTDHAPLDALLNFLPPRTAPVFWFPCRTDCEASLEKARSLLGELERDVPGAGHRIRSALGHPTLVAGRMDFLILDGRIGSSTAIEYKGFAWAGDFDPGIHPTPDFEAFRASLPGKGIVRITDRGLVAENQAGLVTGSLPTTVVPPRILDYRF
jgi:hypothetical protein